MSTGSNLPTIETTARPARIFRLVLWVDALVIGGAINLVLVRQMMVDTMERVTTIESQSALLNLLDKLYPYYAAYGIAWLLLMIVTLGVGAWAARAGQPAKSEQKGR